RSTAGRSCRATCRSQVLSAAATPSLPVAALVIGVLESRHSSRDTIAWGGDPRSGSAVLIYYPNTPDVPLPPGHRFPARKYRLLRERILDQGILGNWDLAPSPLAGLAD